MIINQHKQCTLEGCNNLAIYEKNTVHIVILAVTKNAQTKLQAVKGRALEYVGDMGLKQMMVGNQVLHSTSIHCKSLLVILLNQYLCEVQAHSSVQ